MLANTPLDYVSRKDAMELLDVRRDWLIELQESGVLQWYVVGRKVYYKISDLNNLIKKGKQL